MPLATNNNTLVLSLLMVGLLLVGAPTLGARAQSRLTRQVGGFGGGYRPGVKGYEPTQTNIDQQPYYPGATSGFLRSPVAAAAALANPANEPLIGGSAAVATEEVLASQYGPPLGERTSYQSSYGYRYNNGYGNNGYGSKGRAPYPPRGQFGVKY